MFTFSAFGHAEVGGTYHVGRFEPMDQLAESNLGVFMEAQIR